VFLKDARIRGRTVERQTVQRFNVRCSCITRQDLTAAHMAERYLKHLQAITRACAQPGLFIYAVHDHRVERLGLSDLPANEHTWAHPGCGRVFGSDRTPNTYEAWMPAIRTSRSDQTALAIEDLRAIVSPSAGLTIEPNDSADGVTVSRAGRRQWEAKVHARRSLSPAEARALIAAESDEGANVVVADQISAEAREQLAQAPGWSWLDRRGELRLRRGATDFEIRFAPDASRESGGTGVTLAAPASDGPIRGKAGIGYASALLRDPENPPSIRAVARKLGMSPSTVSDAAARLRHAGLVLPSGAPALPDLFWALAAVWQPIRSTPVATVPDLARLTRHALNLDDLSAPGWAQGGDAAALAWGAPMLAVGSRAWLWVPDQATARRAERALGTASWDDSAAVIAVPPTPLVCVDRQHPPSASLTWPTPLPVYLALDLARDRARGHQILEEWEPPGHTMRPWAGPR
jgi:hypothetical protein